MIEAGRESAGLHAHARRWYVACPARTEQISMTRERESAWEGKEGCLSEWRGKRRSQGRVRVLSPISTVHPSVLSVLRFALAYTYGP